MTKRADPAKHLHHLPSETPKPGQLLTPVNRLHSAAIPRVSKAGKTTNLPTDNFGPAAMQRRHRQARITSVDLSKAPLTNATSRAPLVAPRPASLRPGAEDYSSHPSIVSGKRTPYTARCGA